MGDSFFLSFLFILVASAFFAFGIFVKQGYSPFGRVILLVASGAFILLGLATAAHHVRNVMRGKK